MNFRKWSLVIVFSSNRILSLELSLYVAAECISCILSYHLMIHELFHLQSSSNKSIRCAYHVYRIADSCSHPASLIYFEMREAGMLQLFLGESWSPFIEREDPSAG